MRAYEFYQRKAMEGLHLVGILPERRKNRERITEQSVLNWGRMIFGGIEELNLLFVEVTIDDTGVISYPPPSFGSKGETWK